MSAKQLATEPAVNAEGIAIAPAKEKHESIWKDVLAGIV